LFIVVILIQLPEQIVDIRITLSKLLGVPLYSHALILQIMLKADKLFILNSEVLLDLRYLGVQVTSLSHKVPPDPPDRREYYSSQDGPHRIA